MSATKTLLICTLCFVVTLSSACKTETLVTKVDPNNPGTQRTDGVLFSLPETVVVAEVPLTKTASSPGVFSEWTTFFYPELTSDNYTTEEKTSFKVGEPTFTTRGQTDPNNVYMAHIKAKQFETKTLLVEFNDDGIIARVEASSKDESIDIVTSGLKTVASIAAPLLHVGSPGAPLNNVAVKAAAETDEQYFMKHLSEQDQALYSALSQKARDFLRYEFGFPFLVYVAQMSGSTDDNSAGIGFFLTLNEKQRNFISAKPHTTNFCPALPPPPPGIVPPPAPAPAGQNCLDPDQLIDLVKALAAYNKIQTLRLQREKFVGEPTPPQVANSTNLEFRLKQLDDQITAIEHTYFLGTSSETTAKAKFEFKPGGPGVATANQNFFVYAAGGGKPGICAVNPEISGNFKAVWPKNLKGECHAAGPQFEAGDFHDLKKLNDRLKKAATGGAAAAADPVSVYVYGQLTGPTQVAVNGPAETPLERSTLRNALIADLNLLVAGGSIYSPATFAKVNLSSDTIKLLNTPGGVPVADVHKFNRLLLEDAYAQELYRQNAWTGRQVAMVVDAATPGIAQTVRTASLTESGKRGFPYRVPASTVARLTDDGIEKGRSDVRVAQFGPVQTLPANLGGRRSSYKITYYDASGAIKVFDMSADALIQKSNVTDLTDAATTLRDAEATRLARETDLLTKKKAKLDAEKALKDAQGTPTPTPSPE
ncbi:MAG TPA: DUF4831 family protein [Pyrinomonadaceae bacterium]|nr:DUF4831 family protein [Pyrinomonadaceae bacterium]